MQLCLVSYCEIESYCKGYCLNHYFQQVKGKPLTPITRTRATPTVTTIPCTFDGCLNYQVALGLCNGHWSQQNKGKPLKKLRNQCTLLDRAFEHIVKDSSGCWIWTGRACGPKRQYGQISYKNSSVFVHRAIFEELVRPLIPGETLDHLCRTTLCVNPEHLEPVTIRENVQRMHAYRSLQKEIDRLKKLVISLGGDPKP